MDSMELMKWQIEYLKKKDIIVVCPTLKRAGILYERFIRHFKLPNGGGYSCRCVKTRREVRFGDVKILFTSDHHYETVYKFGFRGSIIDGEIMDKDLDRLEVT